ncbi:MAG: ATP-binding cassette domain-containing protein [Asgard group archaeon]|nr:ATP-binding cassette domain-containing protein [Asgard group archaeon]
MIKCTDLIKIYSDEDTKTRIPALRGCDLLVNEGEVLTIIGPSGSGKTTLINILAGLESISSGDVIVGGYNLGSLTEMQLHNYRLQMVGIVDQFPERTLFLDGSVMDNLIFTNNLHQNSKSKLEFENEEILEKLGISHLKNRLVKHLSGGEMIRAAIASALAKKVPILLCDEPTGQLDSENTERVKELLYQITQDFGVTVLVVTHDPRFQEGVDKTCEIRDGRVSTIFDVGDKVTYSGKKKFPLKFKSRIDSSSSARIPDLILKALKLDEDIEFELSKNGDVIIKHPEGVEPETIELEEMKERRKELIINPLPPKYLTSSKAVLQLDNVSKIYQSNGGGVVNALSDINLEIRKGELLFVLGPSGSGKTTLVKLITGLESVTDGSIQMFSTTFSNLNDSEKADFRRENMGLVSQQGNLHPFLTIDEHFYLRDIFSGKKFKSNIYEERVDDFLARFGILHRKSSFPLEISGGELQRASLAIANNDFPPIIVLDEPTANLDSELAEEAITQIYKLHESTDISFIIATHDINLIRDGIRAIELVDGKIKRDGLVTSK